MIRLKESIYVGQDIETVFNYVSDFTNIKEWDPGVLSSNKIGTGEVGVGSTYDLVLTFGLFRPRMSYSTTVFQPFSKVVLKGKGDTYTAIDTIVFKKAGQGTQVDYQADIQFSGIGNYLEAYLSPVLRQIGRKAILGLKQTLDKTEDYPPENTWIKSGSNLVDYLADHAVVPGMLMFSKYGYELSEQFWTEPKQILYGKRVILTGGTSGIGKAAAFKLAEKKAFLTIIARNKKKSDQVRQDIIEQTGNTNVDVLVADLSLMKDIKLVANKIKEIKPSIDILINNAGALYNERTETVEDVENTFATDLLGVFYLTMLLKDSFSKSTGARIINVSSGGMYTQKIDVNDLENAQEPYNGAKAYARAKRGIVILTRIWAEQFRKNGVCVHAMHPGWVDTPGIEKSLPQFHNVLNKILRTPEQGADTIVWLCLSKQGGQSSGQFWLDRRPHETVVFPGTGESEKERAFLWEKLNQRISQI
ncbi:MAG: SDR family NAD(P)-dependent oxidoreductase [Desulfobacterales bacterium]|nr:SDR family NAD(P)-dependent oxidoreductase [Desulfobacterales bacterium]